MTVDLEAVQRELEAREPIFHRPEWGTTRADFDALMAPDYWEVGASGKIYRRELVLEMITERYASGVEQEALAASGFGCRALGAGCYLLTYDLLQGGRRRTRRATVWERVGDAWRIVYHQGTVMEEAS